MSNSISGSSSSSGNGHNNNNISNKEDFSRVQDTTISTTAAATTTTAGRIKEPREGHSKKQQKVLANYRKDMVFSLSSQGYNQSQISGILHVNQSTVSLTLQQLRRDAAASMRQFLSEKLPLIYQECYENISQVINRSWQLVNDNNTPIQAKVALLGLISDATEAKMDLSSGGEVIEQGIAYAQNVKNKYVEIVKTNEILHDDEEDSPSFLNDNSNNNGHNNNGHNNNNGSNGNNNNKKRNTKNSVF